MDDQVVPNDQVPFVEDADILTIMPAYMRNSDPAPVRDALAAAIRVMAVKMQDASTFAALQRDVIYATGDALDSMLVPLRNDGEGDEDYRARGLALRAVVTPEAICSAVNALISPLVCTYIEPELDQFFVPGVIDDGTDHTGDTVWGCFFDVAPQYQDRLYPDDSAANGGVVKPHVNPGPAALFNTDQGRYFVLYVPDLSALNSSIVLVYSGVPVGPTTVPPELGGAVGTEMGGGESLGGTGIFPMGVSANAAFRSFLYSNTTDADTRYAQIVDVVERLIAGSFEWMLLVQPS